MQSTIYNFRLWNVILKLKLPITLPNRTNNSDIVFNVYTKLFISFFLQSFFFVFVILPCWSLKTECSFLALAFDQKLHVLFSFFPSETSMTIVWFLDFIHISITYASPTKYLVRRWRTISTLQSPCTDTGYAVLQPCRYKSVHKLQGSSSHSIIQNIFTTRQHNVFNTKQPVDEFLISPAVYPYNGKVWD